MIQYNQKCKVCKRLKTNGGKQLAERIYASRAYVKGGEAIQAIANDYIKSFSAGLLKKHIKEHQFLEDELDTKAAKKDVAAAKVRELITHQELRQQIMDIAGEQARKGELKGITAAAALKAAKDQSDIEEKQKDRALEMAKMINYFASGELKRTPDGLSAPQSAGSLNPGV